jgi:hypothetical protein
MNWLPLAAQSLVDPVSIDQFVVKAEVLADATFVAAEEFDFFDVKSVFVGGVATAARTTKAFGLGVEGDPLAVFSSLPPA